MCTPAQHVHMTEHTLVCVYPMTMPFSCRKLHNLFLNICSVCIKVGRGWKNKTKIFQQLWFSSYFVHINNPVRSATSVDSSSSDAKQQLLLNLGINVFWNISILQYFNILKYFNITILLSKGTLDLIDQAFFF